MTSGMKFRGHGEIPVDSRLVDAESRAEIVEGLVLFALPAKEPHALRHADLAYVLRAHVIEGYWVAVDMLTRTGKESDFAPDASVYRSARDEETGGRHLEELAFEIVSEQELSVQTTKARLLAARGVRRIFALVLKKRRCVEWSLETDGWSAAAIERVEDRCFARPLSIEGLLDASSADVEVVRALEARHHPAVLAIREQGREEGRREGREEVGFERGLRIAVEDFCESLGIPVDPARREAIASMNAEQLDGLRFSLKARRAWP